MELVVLRFSSQSDSTSGLLFEKTPYGMFFLCYTLEDEKRDVKVAGETRIPAGKYKIAYEPKEDSTTSTRNAFRTYIKACYMFLMYRALMDFNSLW